MSHHDARGFRFGGGRGFIAILDPDPSKAAYQGMARDKEGRIHGVFARQNYGDVEFLTYPEQDLREDTAFFHLLEKGAMAQKVSFELEGDNIAWTCPTTFERHIIATKLAESPLRGFKGLCPALRSDGVLIRPGLRLG